MPILLGGIFLVLIGYSVERKRMRLRRIFDLFDQEEVALANLLEEMVATGELAPSRRVARA